MSDPRRRSSYNDSSPEPVVIERRPQLYNLFKIRKKKVHIIEEEPVRRRERHIRTPSFSSSLTPSPPPPPSPPRRPYRPMSSRLEGDVYAPLPPELPHKGKHRHDDVANIVERIPRRDSGRRVKIVHGDRRDPDDEDAYPKVENPGSKRDSGKYYVTTSEGEPSGHRREYERRRPNADHEVERLVDDLAWEKRQRREAERAAAYAEDKVNKLQDKLYQEQRERSLEKKERDILEREKRLSQEREKRLSQEREMERERERAPARVVEIRPRPATRDRNDVVVVHNPRERGVVQVSGGDAGRSALERARDDYNVQRRQQQYEERRPGTSGGAGRGQVVIVDDDDYRPRPRR
ncbi:hypothetical protein, variant 4 [Exophiala xenobiotica]|uniref:Uncharacterized protein n=1 Tax=Exophiala xenobiotica TaxID=348802 RepID=A0A0D2D130_9EURO|nr:hypothetical protein, variant 4 [Exophiala xenobiotica]KIW56092.1 hypothetical protein, variant 4 [Exophiala xenobiotica]